MEVVFDLLKIRGSLVFVLSSIVVPLYMSSCAIAVKGITNINNKIKFFIFIIFILKLLHAAHNLKDAEYLVLGQLLYAIFR